MDKDKNKKVDEEKEQRKRIAAGATMGAGILAVGSQFKNGNLTGRETLYHQTDKKNISSILKNGVKASYSRDPNNVTNTSRIGEILREQGKKTPEYTYFGRKRINLATPEYREAVNGGDVAGVFRALNNRKYLKVKAPVWKMKTAKNPELLGVNSKSRKRGSEWISKMDMPLNPINYYPGFIKNRLFDTLDKGTVTVDGDMPSKYIKGSKDYKKTSMNEVKDYIKHNPKRFAKGVAVATAGTAAATAGGIYLAKKLKEKREREKQKRREDDEKTSK